MHAVTPIIVLEYQMKIVRMILSTTCAQIFTQRIRSYHPASIRRKKEEVYDIVTCTIISMQYQYFKGQLISILPFFLTVLYSDFVRSNNRENCAVTANNTMRIFEFPSEYITDEESAMQLCERYCLTKEYCWGCSKNCSTSCQWIAVSSCKQREEMNFFDERAITQKPGIEQYNLILNKNYDKSSNIYNHQYCFTCAYILVHFCHCNSLP